MTFPGNVASGRAAALAILALLILAAWIGPISTYLDLLDSGAEQMAQREALLQRYRSLVQAPTEAAAPATATPQLLFPEVAEAQAVALLQERVKTAAAANRIRIHSLQVLRSEAVGDASRIGVRIRGAGDAASLGQLLYAVESARPVLYPDNLQIHAPPVPADAAGSLEFQLDISGFRAGPAS